MFGRSATIPAGLTMLALAWSGVAAQHHDTHDARALDEDPRTAGEQIAPVLGGLGDLHHPITTASERAQAFFDQGLRLTYGFNHQEALRSFKEAARLDSDAAMAYWGWALVLGPNLNLPMQPEVVEPANEAIRLAVEHKGTVSPREGDYIDALAKRYSGDPEADRAALDAAYADAMRKLHDKYPEDHDAATLYAAALMNLSPWNYWTPDGRPRERTRDILSALEGVIARDPRHTGALHYYIHAVESSNPRRGEKAADLLRGLAPGAGHLVHMPSHIYMRVGRYAEAFEANVQAARADEGYLAQCRAQGIYPLNYYPHNVHFAAWAAFMQGRGADALAAARKVAARVPEDMHGNDWALYQTFLSMPLFTMVRFGAWDSIFAEPRPSDDTLYWQGIWHYARGIAFVHQDRIKNAKIELAALRRAASDASTTDVMIGFSNAGRLLEIATEVLSAEVAATKGKYDEAVGRLDRAVRLEDGLLYNEPPDWYYPVRHTLGAVLLDAGRPREAEVVYWQDLENNPDNGWALYGLRQSLEAQERHAEADEIERRFDAAWAAADSRLESSRF